MSLVVPWLVFPAVMAGLSLGCGLLLERAARVRLPRVLLIPVGLAVIVVSSQLATATDATAELAVPLAVVLAAGGFALWPRLERPANLDGWAFAAAAAVFAVYAAPVVLSGQPTWAGWIKLDDNGAWFAIVDHVLDHGRNLEGLVPSSHTESLAMTLNGGYPVGSFLPLGIAARILRHDPAWLVQPWMAFLGAALALVLNRLLASVVADRRLRAFCSFVAAQPAVLFGYSLWGGVKELAAAWVLALAVALLEPATRHHTARAAVPLAVAVAATISMLSVGGALWLMPALLFLPVAIARRWGLQVMLRLGAKLAAAGLVLGLPSLALAQNFVHEIAAPGRLLTSDTDIGNLYGPLPRVEMLGVWLSGDFRVDPSNIEATSVLLVLVGVAAVFGVVVAVRRRAWLLALYAGATAAIGLAVATYAGPWVAGKALAIASPAVLVIALAGAAEGWRRGRRFESSVVAAAIAGGVLWSNALAYHDVNIAPRDQLAELDRIGHLIAGEGPTLMTEYNPNGARHFLRSAAADSVSELRARFTPLRDGSPVAKLRSADTDQLQLRGLLVYRTLVLRRSPVQSRPPRPYRLTWTGRTYEVWQRPERFTRPLAHLPLGNGLAAGAAPRCDDVRNLAALSGPSGTLVSVARPAPAVVINLGGVRRPGQWLADRRNGSIVYPITSGGMAIDFSVANSGEFHAWLGGSSRGLLTVAIDGRRVAAVRHVLNYSGGYISLGKRWLRAGKHRVTITYKRGGLSPGSGSGSASPFSLGPFMLTRANERLSTSYTPAADWRALCGRSLDWIEAFRPALRG